MALGVGCAFVDEHDLLPTRGREHVARNVDDAYEVQAADVDAADRAVVEVVGVERVARTSVGVLADPARAKHAARARLEQRALEFVHDLCCVCCRSHVVNLRLSLGTRP